MEHGPVKVGMVIVMQHDLKGAVEFYRDVLKLPLKFHLDGKWAEFDLGCVKFGLCPISQKQDNVRTGIVLEVRDDLQTLYESLKDKVNFLSEPIVAVHGVMVGFKDSGGNVLDLYQATPEKVQELAKKEKENMDDSDQNNEAACNDESACACDSDQDSKCKENCSC